MPATPASGKACVVPEPLSLIHAYDCTRLDAEQLHQAKRCLLDLLGVAAGATRTPLAAKAVRYVTRQHGGDLPLLFASGTASSSGVALQGGWLIDALDAHDGQVLTKGHAGVALLPGLLALPEARQLSGHAFLALLAYGYEVATRAGIALHAQSPDYHTSGAWNALGVAAVTARLRGFDRETLHHALGIAEFYGPRSQMMRCIDHPTMLKDGSGWGGDDRHIGGVAGGRWLYRSTGIDGHGAGGRRAVAGPRPASLSVRAVLQGLSGVSLGAAGSRGGTVIGGRRS